MKWGQRRQGVKQPDRFYGSGLYIQGLFTLCTPTQRTYHVCVHYVIVPLH